MTGSQLLDSIKGIRKAAEAELAGIRTLDDAAACKVKYLGKKGLVTSVLQKMRNLNSDERPRIGREVNQLKTQLEGLLDGMQKRLSDARVTEAVKATEIDITLPGRPRPMGTLHPITHIQNESLQILRGMGFSIAEGPEC
jgi:phenylalanyl-tRNA synthetase alpha chain